MLAAGDGPARDHALKIAWSFKKDGRVSDQTVGCTCGWNGGPVKTMGDAEEAAKRHLVRVAGRPGARH